MIKYELKILSIFIILFLIMFGIKAEASLPLQGKMIIIDPGHGGLDPGTSYQNIYEKDINLKISLYLEEELNKLGASVLLIRDGDYDLSNGVKSHRKRTDFDNRIKIINNSNGDMYLSIHLNYLSNSKYYGAQTFYNKDNEKLAKEVQEHLNNNLKTDREAKTIPSTTYMYNKLEIPGILIECGFLSNDEERNLLITETYQHKLAQTIAASIVKHYY